MNLTDVIGPVMVGPSSSHTAGAVRIGMVARLLLSERIKRAEIGLHGSFLKTGKGHGTDKAILAGLMGLAVDDERIKDSPAWAEKNGMEYRFVPVDLGEDTHPNSVKLDLTGVSGKQMELEASSVGGGQILVTKIDGLRTDFTGEYPTLIVHNLDQPGHVAEVTSMLQHKMINIATMQLYRLSRGGSAVMVVECDAEIPKDAIEWLKHLEGIEKVAYLSLENTGEICDV